MEDLSQDLSPGLPRSLASPSAAARPVPMLRRHVRIYLTESFFEFLKLLRLPAFAIPTVAFPAVFFVLFGLMFNGDNPEAVSAILVAYSSFGVLGATLFGFGVSCAVERGQGWMLLKKASPMPFGAYLFAKTVLSLIFGVAIFSLQLFLGFAFSELDLSAVQIVSLLFRLLLGAVPFCAFGLALAYLSGPNSAAAIVNLIYLPVAFASGMWMPVQMLPEVVQKIAHYLPSYHYLQLALAATGQDLGESTLTHVAVLFGFALSSVGLATMLYKRDEGRTYG